MTNPRTAARYIDYLPLSKLARATRNAKRHDADAIRGSISRWGVADSPVLDDRTERLIAGHGRVEDLTNRHAAGEAPPDGIEVLKDGDWGIPVQRGWASRNDAEADALAVALNRATELGGWDDAVLSEILEDLADDPDLFVSTGFTDDYLDDLLAARQELDPPEETPTGDGTQSTPSLGDYAARYEEQGRRIIVLDYTKDEYSLITTRLALLRDRLGVESNSTALLSHLTTTIPEAEVPEADE